MKEEIKSALNEYIEGLLKLLGESATIQITHETDREIGINLQGLQLLDGTDPKPLRSLSYLAEISMRRKTGKGIKVYLDSNGMQERRVSDLRNLAVTSAERVINEQTRVELPPMETQDRKLVHELLSEYKGVKTHSEGQGEERRIIIEPAGVKHSSSSETQEKEPEQSDSGNATSEESTE